VELDSFRICWASWSILGFLFDILLVLVLSIEGIMFCTIVFKCLCRIWAYLASFAFLIL